MIFYKLTDEEARRAVTAMIVGVPFVALLALRISDAGRHGMAIGFVVTMMLAFSLILVQIVQSRRLDRIERERAHG